MALSDIRVKALKPKDKKYRVLDADKLYIEVLPTGTKVWKIRLQVEKTY